MLGGQGGLEVLESFGGWVGAFNGSKSEFPWSRFHGRQKCLDCLGIDAHTPNAHLGGESFGAGREVLIAQVQAKLHHGGPGLDGLDIVHTERGDAQQDGPDVGANGEEQMTGRGAASVISNHS